MQPVDVMLHRARQQRLARGGVELLQEQRREAGAAAASRHVNGPHRGTHTSVSVRVLDQVGSQLVGVGVGLKHGARLREVVEERQRLSRVALSHVPVGLRCAVQHVQPDHLEVEGHLGRGKCRVGWCREGGASG